MGRLILNSTGAVGNIPAVMRLGADSRGGKGAGKGIIELLNIAGGASATKRRQQDVKSRDWPGAFPCQVEYRCLTATRSDWLRNNDYHTRIALHLLHQGARAGFFYLF